MRTNHFTTEELNIIQDPLFQQVCDDARPFINDNHLDLDALHNAHPEYIIWEVAGGKAMIECVTRMQNAFPQLEFETIEL